MSAVGRMTRLGRAGLLAGWSVLLVVGSVSADSPLAGPPYPAPIDDVSVYDYAEILSPTTEAAAQRIIVAIEQRVGAEVVVYTQYKPGSDDESTDEDARALINQWGVGRAGFDDGLAIMWNTNRLQCLPGVSGNGRIRLYAAPGYQAAYLTNEERQSIFDNDMLPYLRQCDEDSALLAALEKIDENATPEHANKLNAARFIDAAVGLIGGPVAFFLLVSWAGFSWLRYGRDPVYLDDPSIHIPAPPADLTAASGAVVWEGKSSRRALTTAMLDLASRGEMSFREEESGLLGLGAKKAGIQILDAIPDDPQVGLNRRKPLSAAEMSALGQLKAIASPNEGNYIDSSDMLKFGKYVDDFDRRIEKHVTDKGWFREPPGKVTARWVSAGTLALVAGIIGMVIAFNLPSAGLAILSGAIIAAAVIIFLLSRVMPARTMAGAMIYAMLAAYRRTLQKTMAQARSMKQVVEQAKLDWLETPDQAVVWGVALGLQSDVELVLERSVDDARAGVTAYNPWLPAWYGGGGWGSNSPGPSGIAPGLFSSSVIPNFGGMMSALSSIGNSPSSSGSGSGGFSGGGGGGGGGGAGGGY